MTCIKDKRHFSSLMRDTNSPFLANEDAPLHTTTVGFVLQEHFSMMAFTAAVDALITANLVRTTPLFSYQTLAVDSSPVISDLGIGIAAQDTIRDFTNGRHKLPDILVVCGGYRCSTAQQPHLSQFLKDAQRHNVTIGSLWNGAIALAHAGLLDDQECALHPDNHAFMQEHFPRVRVSDQVIVSDQTRLTSAGPSSALEMMLSMIEQTQGKEVVRAIREILSCDQTSENSNTSLSRIGDDPCLPQNLRDIMELMAANIEEPMSMEELSAIIGISRRQLERLFQNHLDTSPSRYYLELRLTQARRLLMQSNEPVTNIALACGFVTSSHFSNCFKDYFGLSPSHARDKFKNA